MNWFEKVLLVIEGVTALLVVWLAVEVLKLTFV